MNVLAASVSGAQALPVHGPADLLQYGPGAVVVVLGEAKDSDPGRWASALGLAAIRGADLVRRFS